MGKLKQASPVKFYFAKFFFLGFALLQWAVAIALAVRFENTPKNTAAIFIFISLGCIFFVVFYFLMEVMRRVAIGKDRVVVIELGKNLTIEWPDVKSIKIIPVFNIYKMRLKTRKKPIYFLPSKNIEPAYDLLAEDTSKMGDIVNKNKKKLGI
jgi:hypothetical protein